MKLHLSNIILFIILDIISIPLFAQEVPSIFNFSKTEYKGYNQNWAVAQALDYTMYFANSGGLLEFDGTVWKTWSLPDNQIIRSVNCDSQGRIYIGAFGEFGYWERDSTKKMKYQSLSSMVDFEKVEKEEIWHILVEDEFVLFQSFSTIYLYDGQRIAVQDPPNNIMFSANVNERLLFQVIGSGLFELKGDNNFALVPGTEILSDKEVTCILPLSGDFFLVGTAHHGLFKYEKEKLTPFNEQVHHLFKTWQLNKGVLLSNGNYAFGTILNGVFILDNSGNLIQHINQKNGLQNNTVLALKEDRAHNLWVGLDKGIDLIELSSPLTSFKDKNGILGTVYSAALYKGRLYVGTNQGVFYKNWEKLSSIHGSDFQFVEGTQGQVWELKEYEGHLLCGHNDGTFLIKGSKAKKISDVTGGWMTTPHPQVENVLLQGTYTGIIVFRKFNQPGENKPGEWEFSHRVKEFIEPVKELVFDNKGFLWASNPTKGLHRIQLDSSLENITSISSFSEKDGLISEFYIDMETMPLSDRDELLLFQSNNQWLTFDDKDNRFQPYYFNNDLFGKEKVFKIKTGRKGDRFQITPGKITLINDQTSQSFSVSLVSQYENIVPLDSSTYLFCLDNGYAILNEPALFSKGKSLINNTQTPRFSKIEVLGKIPRTILPPHSFNLPVTFASHENHVRFNFTQPVFTQKPNFSYRLEGFGEDWLLIENGYSKEFTNLQDGDYTLHIKSNLSNEIISLPFVIQPHWFETTWAMVLYFLGLIAAGWLLLRGHRGRLEKQRQKLEEETHRQLEEHRIRVANENLQRDVISKSRELANSTINLIQKNEILLQIKKELKQAKRVSGGRFAGKDYQNLLHVIDVHLTSEHDWELFEKNFNQVHEQFIKKIKTDFSELTPGDLRLAAYLKMNLTSKEIAPLLGISIRGVENKRYRLRKKLGLSPEANLIEFMMKY